jgi:hypothetical protein
LPLPQRASEVSHSAQYFERKWANLLMAQETALTSQPDGVPTFLSEAYPDKLVRVQFSVTFVGPEATTESPAPL